MKEQVLKAMREFGAPVNAGKIAEITGLDRKDVDKAFAELKKEGAIVSPVRCKWEPTKIMYRWKLLFGILLRYHLHLLYQ